MADESENVEPEQKPKRRRRKKPPEGASASKARRSAKAKSEAQPRDASASEEETAPQTAVDEIEPTAEDVQAEEEAADVVIEAEAEVDEDTEAEAEVDEDTEPEAEEEAAEPEADEPPPAPAPRRRRAQRDPNLPPPVVRAQAKYVRSSARKARLVCDHLRGKSVEDARAILAHAPRAVARDWSKLLESAVANAEHNHELVGEDLLIKTVQADDGPTIKRYRPRALGRATRIRKRTSHLTILLTPKE